MVPYATGGDTFVSPYFLCISMPVRIAKSLLQKVFSTLWRLKWNRKTSREVKNPQKIDIVPFEQLPFLSSTAPKGVNEIHTYGYHSYQIS